MKDTTIEFFGDADAKQAAVVELRNIKKAGEAYEARTVRVSELKDAKFKVVLWCKDAAEARLHRDILNNRDPRGKGMSPNPHDTLSNLKKEKPGTPVKQLSEIKLVASAPSIHTRPIMFRQVKGEMRVFGSDGLRLGLGKAMLPLMADLKSKFFKGSVAGMKATVSSDVDFGSNDVVYWLHVPVTA